MQGAHRTSRDGLPGRCLLMALLTLVPAAQALAFGGGISGRTTLASGPGSCSECHAGSAFPGSTFAIDFFGARVNPGSSNDFEVELSSNAPFGGFNLAADGGSFTSLLGQSTRLTTEADLGGADAAGQLTHLQPTAGSFNKVAWGTNWTAPQAPGTYTLAGCALPANGSRDESGDGPTVCAVKQIQVNAPPEFTSVPVTAATQGEAYSYVIGTSDPDDPGSSLSVTAAGLPAWLTLVDDGDGSATLSGTPGNADVGDHPIVLTVTDGLGLNAEQSFTLAVANVNDPPAFSTVPVTAATQDQPYSYTARFGDPDPGDAATLSVLALPAWLSLSEPAAGSALLEGTPGNAEVGVHRVELRIVDAGNPPLDAIQGFDIVVANVNDPPGFLSQPPVGQQSGSFAYDPILVADPDPGDALTMTVSGPAWLALSANGDGSFALTGTPTIADLGPVQVTLRVQDRADGDPELLFADQAFQLEIVSEPPVISTSPPLQVEAGTAYRYDLAASDGDIGDSLSVSARVLPGWLSLTDQGDGTATLSGTPSETDQGQHPVVLRVTDSVGNFVEQNFTVTVGDGNLPPLADAGPDQTVAPGQRFRLSAANSVDPDGQILGYSWRQTAGTGVSLEGLADLAEFDLVAPQVSVAEALAFEVRVLDDGGRSASDTTIVNITLGNAPPTADAGDDQTRAISATEAVVLDGSRSGDADGSILGYEWVQVGGAALQLSGADSVQASFIPQIAGSFEFELTVTDDGGLRASDRVRVTVSDRNLPPLVSVEAPTEPVVEGTALTLVGTASGDGAATIVSSRWRQLGGPAVALSDPLATSVTLVAPPVSSGAELVFEFTATDSNGLSATAQARVAVLDNGIDLYPAAAFTFLAASGHPLGLLEGLQGKLVWLRAVAAEDLPAGTNLPSQLPFGAVELRLRVEPGTAADLSALFPQPVPRGFGFFVQDSDLSWIDLTVTSLDAGATTLAFSAEARRFELVIQDGGPGDADGLADGTVTLLGGIGLGPADGSGGSDVPIVVNSPTGKGALGGALLLPLLVVLLARARRRGGVRRAPGEIAQARRS